MADGQDPLADYQNAIGLQGLIGPNPYLQYQGKIPVAGFYTGQGGNQPPTDAMGNPIQSFVNANNTAQQGYQQQLAAFNAQQPQAPPGTTLNSTPQTPQTPIRMATTPEGMPAGQTNLGRGVVGSSFQPNPYAAAAPAQQQPTAPTPPAPPDMRQAYLDALANPGKVNTPGAQAIPNTTPTGPYGYNMSPGVTNSFLQAHPGGGQSTAPGVQNQGFFNTLNQLQQKGPTLAAMSGGGGS